MKRLKKPKLFFSKFDRHLLMNYDEMIKIGADETLDILLDHGFSTNYELTRLDNVEQNLVEFVQILDLQNEVSSNEFKFKQYKDIEPSGEDEYH